MTIKNIAIFGVGLIGGSFSLGLKAKGFPAKITGFGRNSRKLTRAVRKGIIDEYSLDWEKIKSADLVMLAVPVDLIAPTLKKIAPYLKENAIVTDVGSVKGFVLSEVKKIPGKFLFVAGHPMAGAEKSGAEFASSDLFRQATVVLTPERQTNRQALGIVKKLWKLLEARVIEMPSQQHDEIVAVTSHLPHLMAASLVRLTALCQKKNKFTEELIAGSFRDLTRVASSSPEIWTGICAANRQQILLNLKYFQKELDLWRRLLENNSFKELRQKFMAVQRWRQTYVQNNDKKNKTA
ncbi:MAG: prephenate dehydrogenase/arogenate dehydrogenase family protein [Elusimicrobiota bacterium]